MSTPPPPGGHRVSQRGDLRRRHRGSIQDLADLPREFLHGPGLRDEAGPPERAALVPRVMVGVAAGEKKDHVVRVGPQGIAKLRPPEPGHHNVREHQVDLADAPSGDFEGLHPVLSHQHLIAEPLEAPAGGPTEGRQR